jgi:peptidoglycan/LPS O-acetylase OafA/YrhL
MQKIKYLEGLRGVAAMIVFFDHLRNISFFREEEHLTSYILDLDVPDVVQTFIIDITELLFEGHLAVWVFWVLSSYVISILFFKKGGNYDKIIIGYFSKRYFRLLIPVLASVIFAYLLLQSGLMYHHELAALQGPPYFKGWMDEFYNFEPDIFIALRTAFYDTFFQFEFKDSYNTALWSIQNEFLGSLFTFSIFGIIRHNAKRYILYLLIVVVILALNLHWLLAFVAGHILCDLDFSTTENKIISRIKIWEEKIHKNKILIFTGSILLIISGKTLLTFLNVPFKFHNLILSIFIVYVCSKNQYYRSLFSMRFIYWLGTISFSIYLLHLPVICSLTCFLIIQNCTLMGKIIAVLITIPVVFVLATVFTKYVDRNGIKIANKIGDYFKQHS